jgi:hypothetical protein
MKNNNSNNKPKKNGRKIQLPAKGKSKKLKLKTKETVLPISNYNGGAVFTINEVNKSNTTTGSTATTYTVNVDATNYDIVDNKETVITSLPNKEELYSKYTDFEEEAAYNNSVVPKANNDGVKTMIIVAGAFALIAFLALVLS